MNNNSKKGDTNNRKIRKQKRKTERETNRDNMNNKKTKKAVARTHTQKLHTC